MDFVDVVGAGQLLAFGSANLIVTVLALRHARRTTELANHRLEALRAEQARIVALLRDERRIWRREMEGERASHLSLSEARRREQEATRQQTPASQVNRAGEELKKAIEAREGERRARLETERRIAWLETEIQGLREAMERQGKPAPVAAGIAHTSAKTRRPLPKGPPEAVTGSHDPYETAASVGAAARRHATPKRAVWHPHPDAGRGASGTGAPVEMFRKHYDKYLENYSGYVELVEEINRTRQAGGTSRSPFGDRELQDRLRRLEDGIARTTSRLDLLEQYNPQLATDDRISRRAEIAARHSRLS